MLSKEAVKAKKKYKKLGGLIAMLVVEPWKPKMWKVKAQRFNFDYVIALNPKSKGHKKEKLTLAGMETWKVTAPNSDPDKILLFFHGGAYQVGSAKGYYPMLTHMARETGFTIYVPNYRLAPENYYPAQVEDGVAAYEALINDLGYSPDQIAIGGDSAGGNMSLVTLLKLKELGKTTPSAIICISPWADPAATGDTYTREVAEKDLLIGAIFKRMWDEYDLSGFGGYFVKEEDLDENNPYICPIRGDYTDCPPVMIQVGGDELLLSDSRTLKEALDRDGVDNEYKEWEGLWHVFQIEAKLPESIESFKLFGEFLNKHIKVKV
jgi:monoterpene epsilon-lactone hydrolase